MTDVVVLDYGSGNLASAERALRRTGASVEVTVGLRDGVERRRVWWCPGSAPTRRAWPGCRRSAGSGSSTGGWPAAGRCSGSASGCRSCSSAGSSTACRPTGSGSGRAPSSGCRRRSSRTWAGTRCEPGAGSVLFDGLDPRTRFYFVHSYAVRRWELEVSGRSPPPVVTWAEHGGDRFVAAVENGPLSATQFHPEKSGRRRRRGAPPLGCHDLRRSPILEQVFDECRFWPGVAVRIGCRGVR